ncbi:MAG: DegV family protein [Thermodesulfobacteriota bacterium]
MTSIGITTDSTADFPEGVAEKFNIRIMPVHVVSDSKDYLDGIDISGKEVLDKMKNNSSVFTRPGTPAEYADLFENMLKKYDQVLSFHIASNLSECFQSAKNGLKLLPPEAEKRVKIFDTKSTSIGQAMYVIKACEILKKDKTIKDIENKINLEMVTCVSNFTVESLKWLKKNGKIGSFGAAFGNMLDLKPLIVLKDSSLKPIGNIRGKKNILNEMASYAGKTKQRTGFDYEAWITHCEAQEDADYLGKKLGENLETDISNIKIIKAGASIAAQTGPGSIGWGMIKK